MLIELIDLIMKLVAVDETEKILALRNVCRDALDMERVKELATILTETENNKDRFISDRFTSALYNLFQFLIVKKLLDCDKQEFLLEFLAVDAEKLMVNKHFNNAVIY